MFSRGISTALAGLLHQLLLANFFGNTSAQQYSPPASLDVSAKLVSLLQDPTVKEHGNVARALDIIRSAETLPSCQRKATAELIKDCKTLEHSPGYVAFSEEVALELVRTEYAVRLALCELQVGEDTVHPACKPAVLSRESCHDNRFRSWLSGSNDECFRGFSKEQQKKCVRALGSQPQTWTSYSNARQNGVIVCQASRINIDRENDVARYQNLSYAVTHLEDALNSSTDRLKTFVADLVEQVRLSQEQALKDMNSNYETQVSDLGEYYNDTMNSVTDMVMTRVITLFRDLDRPADQVQTKLQNVFEEMVHSMNDIHQKSMQLAATRDLAVVAQQNKVMAHLDSHLAEMEKLRSIVNDIAARQEVTKNHTADMERHTRTIALRHEAMMSDVEVIHTRLNETARSPWIPQGVFSMSLGSQLLALSLVMVSGLSMFNRQWAGMLAVLNAAISMIHLILKHCGAYAWPEIFATHSMSAIDRFARLSYDAISSHPTAVIMLSVVGTSLLLYRFWPRNRTTNGTPLPYESADLENNAQSKISDRNTDTDENQDSDQSHTEYGDVLPSIESCYGQAKPPRTWQPRSTWQNHINRFDRSRGVSCPL